MRRLAVALLAAVLALGVLTAANGAAGSREGVPRLGHVFLIIGENTDYARIDAASAPYLTNRLRPRAAWFTSYYAATHWSQANYVALVTGQFTACEQKDGGASCRQDVDNLYHQLDAAHRTWKVWLESGAAKCDTGSGGSCTSDDPCPSSGFYTTGNPPILFDDIPPSECLANDVPAGTDADGMSTFNAALAAGRVADFTTIIPNGCEDGESNCKPINDRYTQFDSFLAREVPLIQASPAYGADDLIVILYDEDERMGGLAGKNGLGSGGHTVCLVLGPRVAPGDVAATTYSYSVLRTLEDGFGVPLLGSANAVAPLPIAWR